MTIVHGIAFRHRTPGEGVGGCEWSDIREIALARAKVARTDPDYECSERAFLVVGLDPQMLGDERVRELITDAIDDAFWSDFHGQYDGPQRLEDWDG